MQDGSTPRAGGSAPGTPGGSAAGALADPLTAMGASLAEFGKQLITGTKEVLETVRCSQGRRVATGCCLLGLTCCHQGLAAHVSHAATPVLSLLLLRRRPCCR